MKPVTQEWIKKAEGDWVSAGREVTALIDPNPDLVCFLAQQCAEKYLEAKLHEDNFALLKTHDLEKLLEFLLTTYLTWETPRPALAQLTDYGVAFRYPGETASMAEAQETVELCPSHNNTTQPLTLTKKGTNDELSAIRYQ